MGYVANPSLTDLGVLRPEGTAEDQQDEGLGLSRAGRRRLSRGGRAFGAGAAIRRARARRAQAASRIGSDPRRRLALTMGGRGRPVRRLGRRARQRAYAARKRGFPLTARPGGTTFARRPRRRGGIGGMVSRMRERARTARARQQTADAERAAAEALAITEAERLARETVTGKPGVTNGAPWPPTVTDRDGWGRPRRDPGLCAGVGPPNRARGWICYQGKRWRRQMPGGGWADEGPRVGIAIACDPPTAPSPGMRCIGGRWYGPRGEPEGTEVPKAPTARPWWMGRAPDGEIPLRDTSGIPTPPGLPGGPSMRPPASGPEDTATERVPAEEPAAPGLDVAKLLPLAAAAAFMFMRK